MLSDSEIRCPGFFLFFLLQRMITGKHSVGFQCNLVHEQTTLSPSSCFQIIYDLFLSFLHSFGFSTK